MTKDEEALDCTHPTGSWHEVQDRRVIATWCKDCGALRPAASGVWSAPRGSIRCTSEATEVMPVWVLKDGGHYLSFPSVTDGLDEFYPQQSKAHRFATKAEAIAVRDRPERLAHTLPLTLVLLWQRTNSPTAVGSNPVPTGSNGDVRGSGEAARGDAPAMAGVGDEGRPVGATHSGAGDDEGARAGGAGVGGGSALIVVETIAAWTDHEALHGGQLAQKMSRAALASMPHSMLMVPVLPIDPEAQRLVDDAVAASRPKRTKKICCHATDSTGLVCALTEGHAGAHVSVDRQRWPATSDATAVAPASDYDAGLMTAERIVRQLAMHRSERDAGALYDAADHIGQAAFTHPRQRPDYAQEIDDAKARVGDMREALHRLLMVLPPSAVQLCHDEIQTARDVLSKSWSTQNTTSAFPTRGHRINRKATIGARLITLASIIAETEKTARKTPPKTLFAERVKVENAKGILESLYAERDALTAERATLEAVDAETTQKRGDGNG